MLNEDQAEKLTSAVREGKNILIAGGTGSGKTTLLNVLSDAIPNEERILNIEDTAELSIRKPHIVSAESQTDTHRGQISFDDLLKAGLRHRPDRIIVGEVRGVEARTLLDAMNTGHRGTLATIHASGCIQAIARLAALANRVSVSPGIEATELEVRKSLDMVAFISRSEGHRHVGEILSLAQDQ
jgi:pilus assembly protein CpaF